MENTVTPEMRDRLNTNRDGRLTTDQWKDMVTEPLVTLLVLSIPAAVLLVTPVGRLAIRNLWFFALLIVVIVFVPLILRARRYARAKVHFAKMYAGNYPRPWWAVWRPDVLTNEVGETFRFKRRLAPLVPLRANHEYIVYYLQEPNQPVLLSIAPSDHPDAAQWQPSKFYLKRK